jgi:hypothetical protein
MFNGPLNLSKTPDCQSGSENPEARSQNPESIVAAASSCGTQESETQTKVDAKCKNRIG